jgi:FkbM family methyltransferase
MKERLTQPAKVLVHRGLAELGYILRKENSPYVDVRRLLGHPDSPVIFDVGAHHGETIRRCQRYFKRPTIYSFEPMPSALKILRKRFADAPRVSIHDVALSSSVGRTTLHINQRDIRSSILDLAPAGRRNLDANIAAVEIATTTLDHFCAQHQVSAIDLLKLDVQGAERQVLEGAADLLDRGRMRTMYLEIWFVPQYQESATFVEMHEFLASRGFTLFRLYDTRTYPSGQLTKGDAVFVDRDIAAGL